MIVDIYIYICQTDNYYREMDGYIYIYMISIEICIYTRGEKSTSDHVGGGKKNRHVNSGEHPKE